MGRKIKEGSGILKNINMKREIEFRGLSVNGNEWIYGSLLVNPDNGNTSIFDEKASEINVKPQTVGQLTGFKDFEGNKIFEGDILEYSGIRHEGKRIKDEVEFDVECGGWYGKRTAKTISDILFEQHNEDWKKKQNYLSNDNHKVRVLSNIHDLQVCV